MDQLGKVVQYIKDLAGSLSTEALEEATLLIRSLRTWDRQLREKEASLNDREKRINSQYIALITAKKELEKKKQI